MEPFTKQGISLSIAKWAEMDLVAGFTLKNENLNLGLHVNDVHDHVIANRQSVANHLGFPLEKWICTEQTHRDQVQRVGLSDAGKGSTCYEQSLQDTDGIYTSDVNLLLTMCYADCVPIYFLHQESKQIGLVHAGWKGTVYRIAGNMVETWSADERIDPSEIEVVLGPSICAKCFITKQDVINQIKYSLGAKATQTYQEVLENQFSLDIQLANKIILMEAGVREANITSTEYCTSCSEQFFSHRRDEGNTGRMMAYIGWRSHK